MLYEVITATDVGQGEECLGMLAGTEDPHPQPLGAPHSEAAMELLAGAIQTGVVVPRQDATGGRGGIIVTRRRHRLRHHPIAAGGEAGRRLLGGMGHAEACTGQQLVERLGEKGVAVEATGDKLV